MRERNDFDSVREITPTDFHRLTRENRPRTFVYFYHRHGAETISLEDGASVVVGRSRRQADYVLQVDGVSRQHARFEVDPEGHVWVEDLGSTNGTRVNGQIVQRCRLSTGDEVSIGGASAVLHTRGMADNLPQSLVSHDAFMCLVDFEVYRARTFRRSFGVIVARVDRGHESSLRRWCPQIQSVLRPVDRMGLFSDGMVEILLPEVDLDQAVSLATQLTGVVLACPPKSGEVPLDGAPDCQEVTLGCGVAIFPATATSAEELIAVARLAALRATAREPVSVADLKTGAYAAVPGAQGGPEAAMVIVSPKTRKVFDTARRLAGSDVPVLIIGETGTGKELLARSVHRHSRRGKGQLQAVNCGSLPESLIQSTLFGYQRGAFTGADSDTPGVFEAASGGTLLLDEIGELPMAAQTALLRVLETGQVRRVGATRDLAVDARIIAATNRDLELMVETGDFRNDLLYRLNVVTLRVPPLRERPEEIGPLCNVFIDEANRANSCRVRDIDSDAAVLLRKYDWPGNVRELRNVIERAVLLAPLDLITVDELSDRIRGAPPRSTASPTPTGALEQLPDVADELQSGDDDFRSRIQRIEAALILEALRDADWNQTVAAQRLRIPARTLTRKMRAYGIRRLGYALDE